MNREAADVGLNHLQARTTRGLITMHSLTIYAGVRVSPTGHVRFQDRVSKNLIDLVPPPPAQYLAFTGAMQRLHDR